MSCFHWLILAALVGLIPAPNARLAAQSAPPDALRPTPLSWQTSDLDLTGPSRPGSYVGIVGRQSVAMGTEQGDLEVWTWPLKLLHGFNLRFQPRSMLKPSPVETSPAGWR